MTDERDPLDDLLRHDGSAYRRVGSDWNPDTTDVVRRSHRQQRTARTVVGAATAVVLVVVIGAGVSLGRETDDEVIFADHGTTVPDTRPGTTATTPPTTAEVAPTTVTLPAVTSTTTPVEMPSTTVTVPVPTTTPPTTSTSTQVPVVQASLRTDGLGIFTFGDTEESAVAALNKTFGPPSQDSGWQPVGLGLGPNRVLSWGGLWVYFIEEGNARHVAGWRYVDHHAGFPRPEGTPKLETPDGIHLGMPLTELTPKLGTFTVVRGEGADAYRVERPEGPLYVFLDPGFLEHQGPPAPDSTVGTLSAGAAPI